MEENNPNNPQINQKPAEPETLQTEKTHSQTQESTIKQPQPQTIPTPESQIPQDIPQPQTEQPFSPLPPPKTKTSNNLFKIGIIFLIFSALIAGGYFAYKYLKPDKKQNSTPTPTTTPTSTPDETASWKTYSNTTHNIIFKYSPFWTLTEKEGQVEKGVTYNTKVQLLKDSTKITMYFNMDGIGGMPQNYEGTPFVLDGNNLYQYVNSYNNTKLVGISNSLKTLGVFMLNNITYSITLEYPVNYDETKETELLNEFNQILSTFKFTDQVNSTASWETYINEVFSIKAPKEFVKNEKGSKENNLCLEYNNITIELFFPKIPGFVECTTNESTLDQKLRIYKGAIDAGSGGHYSIINTPTAFGSIEGIEYWDTVEPLKATYVYPLCFQNKTLDIEFTVSGNIGQARDVIPQINQILSTFKFINN